MKKFEELEWRWESCIPPIDAQIIVGGFDYSGAEVYGYLKYFEDECGLKPTSSVLDIGCGCGRFAIYLTKYLKDGGTYEGFDIHNMLVDWCIAHITSAYPHFNFNYMNNEYNSAYNSRGNKSASDYVFDYGDDEFDFVFATSVFTHMLYDEIDQYLYEIHRVLKKGGKALLTHFLINDDSLELLKNGQSIIPLVEVVEQENGVTCHTQDKHAIEKAVGYNEEEIIELYKKYDFKIKKVNHGFWSRYNTDEKYAKMKTVHFQDAIIVEK